MSGLADQGGRFAFSVHREKLSQAGLVDGQYPAPWHMLVQFGVVFADAIHVVCETMLETDFAHSREVVDLPVRVTCRDET